jgi:nicotinate-nucleotide--dimethylbenzimidazole phosphoribosyltransferase
MVAVIDLDAARAARERIDNLTKPQGSLGRIEDLAVQLAAIAGAVPDRPYTRKAILIGAGDHGVAHEGVSAYPQEVTGQMVGAFNAGLGAINAFARVSGADVYVADFGCACAITAGERCFDLNVRRGTRNFAREAALTGEEVQRALDAGKAAFRRIAQGGIDVLALGDMGIANTTCAAAIIAALTGAPVDAVVGRGTGIDEHGLQRKRNVIASSLARFADRDWQTVAREIGGLEILGLAGATIAAAQSRVPVVIDGVIVSAAAVLACAVEPNVQGYLIASHLSVEPGHRAALAHLGLSPLFDLQLRLGEATGAALALPMIEAATRMVCEMRTFAELGVATKLA